MIPFRALVAATLLVLAPASKINIWLQLPGVKGSSTEIHHKDWIVIESYSWGVTAGGASSASASGRGAESHSPRDVHLVKRPDASSADLAKAVFTGTHYPTAELDVGEVRYLFKSVVISGVQQSGSAGGDENPTESITLQFESYEVINPQGSAPKTAAGAMETPTRTAVSMAAPAAAPATAAAAPARVGAVGTVGAGSAAGAASLEAQLAPSLSAAAKQWVGTEGRALSQAAGTADQLAQSAHRAALARFGGIQPNVAGALTFLALMDAAKVNHSAAIQSAIEEVMATTSPAAAGGLTNLK